jgi:hypothetical protein
MRVLIRLLPLLVVATCLGACAANNVITGGPGVLRHAAAPRLLHPPVATARRAAQPSVRKAQIVAAPRVQPSVQKRLREKPNQALLVRQSPPQCDLPKPPEAVSADQAHAAMLDYEQQCYRQRADIVHTRLTVLQAAAAKRRLSGSSNRALLERRPAPHCEPATPAAGLSEAAAREARLDSDRECYKRLEASERQTLADLQDAYRKSFKVARIQRGRAGHAVRLAKASTQSHHGRKRIAAGRPWHRPAVQTPASCETSSWFGAPPSGSGNDAKSKPSDRDGTPSRCSPRSKPSSGSSSLTTTSAPAHSPPWISPLTNSIGEQHPIGWGDAPPARRP